MPSPAPAAPLTPGRLHHWILTDVVERGVAPDAGELARRCAVDVPQVESALRALAAEHGIVLHPGTTRPWVIHPFSLAPTGHALRRGERVWWSPCVWCALGAAALIGGELTLSTALGAERPIELPLVDGVPREQGLVVHFPVPMTRAWDNVIYACSTMLAFAHEADVDDWCQRHAIARGDVQPIARVAELARTWYGRHLRPDWRKWSVEEAREIFREHGLTHPVWDLPASGERF